MIKAIKYVMVFILLLVCRNSMAQKILRVPEKYLRPTLMTDLMPSGNVTSLPWVVFPDKLQVTVYADKDLSKQASNADARFMESYYAIDESVRAVRLASGIISRSGEQITEAKIIGWVNKDDLVLWERTTLYNDSGASPLKAIISSLDIKTSPAHPAPAYFKEKPAGPNRQYHVVSVIKADQNRQFFLVSLAISFYSSNADQVAWVQKDDLFLIPDRTGLVLGTVDDKERETAKYGCPYRTDHGQQKFFHCGDRLPGYSEALLVSDEELYRVASFMELISASENKPDFESRLNSSNLVATDLPGEEPLLATFEKITKLPLSPYYKDVRLSSYAAISNSQFREVIDGVRKMKEQIGMVKQERYPFKMHPYYWIKLEDLPITLLKIQESEVRPEKGWRLEKRITPRTLNIIYANPYPGISNRTNQKFGALADSLMSVSDTLTLNWLFVSKEKVYDFRLDNASKRTFQAYLSEATANLRAPNSGAQMQDKKAIRDRLYRMNIAPGLDHMNVFIFVNKMFFDRFVSDSDADRWLLEDIYQEMHTLLKVRSTVIHVYVNSGDNITAFKKLVRQQGRLLYKFENIQ